tara:strand:+ start:1368 stop:3497 length:2130 start_codon:yes stop_codon:yes gene_type:complete
MKQLTQQLGSGKMEVMNVPSPIILPGHILIKNHFSIISPGTEGSTVATARKGIIGKMQDRPEQVKQVVQTLQKQGLSQTLRAVEKKLQSYSPLGYSSSGTVIEIGEGVEGFEIGDKVACAGVGYANHAEIINVPKNLVVKLSPNADLEAAAYNTIGSIAMQGVRQADLRVGENVVVIGLGLIGQLTCQILKASGINVIGIDKNKEVIDLSRKNSVILEGFLVDESNLTDKIEDLFDEEGADSVIITAATSSLQPINLAGAVSRKRGKVVVVGDVPTGFKRDPDWYKKELSLVMACSYGPGRYDPTYEEHGIDYPFSYVRWTQNRNMKAFQDLLLQGSIKTEYLNTHCFNLEDAPKAYDLITEKKDFYLGISLKYDVNDDHKSEKIIIKELQGKKEVNLSLIGAGSYVQSSLLPYIRNSKVLSKKGVLSSSGTSSKRVAERFKFEFCSSNENDIFESSNAILITTRHNTHAEYCLKAFKKDIDVFVEKPLCINSFELEDLKDAFNESKSQLMVGFNRRFSPLARKLHENFSGRVSNMIFRINAGNLPKDHWIKDPKVGGGRLIGEACHFIDFMAFLAESDIKKINVSSQGDNDNFILNLSFKNGSIGSILYTSNGSDTLSKEYFEIHSKGMSATLDDFKILNIFKNQKKISKKLFAQDKGQKEMVNIFLNSLSSGKSFPIPFNKIYEISKVSILANELLTRGGGQVDIET